jgi:hypothetical protein
MIHRREKTSGKGLKKMGRCSGQECEYVRMQELEKVGRGQRYLEAEN